MKRIIIIVVAAMLLSCGSSHEIKTCHCDNCMDIKIGQMLIAGFKGVEPSAEIKEAIRKYHIGGVIYFDMDVSNDMQERNVRNPEQLARLSASLQKLSAEKPLVISIDQEGGIVNRLKERYGFPASVSAAHIGRVGDMEYARKEMAAMARTLAACGINTNYAPCVDLSVNPENPIIAGKERAFSADADSVVIHSRIEIEELHKSNIVTSLKHFPGHGSSKGDTHLGLVDITDTWSEAELIPYRRLIEDGYDDIVMVGHLINRNIDSLPASLSGRTIQGLLRGELGFRGVVATDDMNMGAIVQNYSLERAISLAINAGVNVIIMGNNAAVFDNGLVARSHQIIKELVRNGDVSPELIDESYFKIMELKARIK